jgi:uncharacterized protein
MNKNRLNLLFTLLLLPSCLAQKSTWTNDFETVFTRYQVSRLNRLLEKNEQNTSNEVVIVTIKTYEPFESLFAFSMDLANNWGIGKSFINNGVLFTFGKEIREVRILVGSGLEEKLSNTECEVILNKFILPRFKKGKYYKGTKKGIKKLLKEIE